MDAHGWEFQLNALAIERDELALTLFANAAYISEVVTRTDVPLITVSGGYTRHRNVIAEGLAPGAFAGAILLPTGSAGDSSTGPCYVEGVEVPVDTNGDGLPDTIEELQAFVSSADAIGLGRLRPLFADQDGDGDLYDHVLGKPTPDWQGSFGGTLSLGRHLSMSTLLEYRAGDYKRQQPDRSLPQ